MPAAVRAHICHTHHQRTSMAQGRFEGEGESGRRAVAQTRSAFPFLGCLRRQTINLTPSEEG